MAMFHVVVTRSGPEYDASRPTEQQSDWPAHATFMDGLVEQGFIVLGGPLDDEHRVVHAVEAESEEAVRDARARSLERDASPGRRRRAVDDPARRSRAGGTPPPDVGPHRCEQRADPEAAARQAEPSERWPNIQRCPSGSSAV